MLIKTSELTGDALDWAVAKCEGFTRSAGSSIVIMDEYSPSTNWAQGGPIIDREGILLRAIRKDGHSMYGQWLAMYDSDNTGMFVQWVDKPWVTNSYSKGSTPLIAAMRCYVASNYVASKLGDTVEIPEDIL